MTPAIVSMSGVSFVFATPFIERCRICRAACVYSCLTRSSSLTRGPSLGPFAHEAAVGRQRENSVRRNSDDARQQGERDARRATSSQ